MDSQKVLEAVDDLVLFDLVAVISRAGQRLGQHGLSQVRDAMLAVFPPNSPEVTYLDALGRFIHELTIFKGSNGEKPNGEKPPTEMIHLYTGANEPNGDSALMLCGERIPLPSLQIAATYEDRRLCPRCLRWHRRRPLSARCFTFAYLVNI